MTSLETPDRKGTITDIVRGFDSLDGFLADPGPLLGALIGRNANRIGHALSRVGHQLDKNDGEDTLEGGPRGFDKRVWTPRAPGADDALRHRLRLNADQFTPVDANLIPMGELRPVAGTPFDFRKPPAIGTRVDQNDEPLKLGRGFDHNWALSRKGESMSLAARVEERDSGRVLEVLTTETGIEFYTGNFRDGTISGKGGRIYGRRSGLCPETQHFPDSENQPAFHFHRVEARPDLPQYHRLPLFRGRACARVGIAA